MKILGLISSPTDPASRARIIQYKDYFSNEGETLTSRYFSPYREADPAPWTYQLKNITGINEWRTTNILKTLTRLPLLIQQYNFDIVWQNRLIILHQFFFEKKIKKPLVFDFDDAIWLNEGEEKVKAAIYSASLVFAGNDYLASYAIKYNKNTHVIPTTVDTKKLYPLYKKNKKFTLGWIGSESNFKYLEIIKPVILDFLSDNKDSQLIIVSSKKPSQFIFDDNQIIFENWNPATENEMINEFSVGLMPLEDNNWTKGKCSFKILQYMACGIPVIVSPVGMNKQLLASGNIGFEAKNSLDWRFAFGEIKNNEKDAREKGENGRLIVEKYFSCEVMTPKIINLFKNIIN